MIEWKRSETPNGDVTYTGEVEGAPIATVTSRAIWNGAFYEWDIVYLPGGNKGGTYSTARAAQAAVERKLAQV